MNVGNGRGVAQVKFPDSFFEFLLGGHERAQWLVQLSIEGFTRHHVSRHVHRLLRPPPKPAIDPSLAGDLLGLIMPRTPWSSGHNLSWREELNTN